MKNIELKLYRPLKRMILTQNFGENSACIKINGEGNIIPRWKATCPDGYISVYKYFKMLGHNGLDFGARDWETTYNSLEGIVGEISTERERGLGVTVVSENKYCYNGGEYRFKIRYWHLAGMNVKVGEKLRVGDVIGWADNTGYSTNTHLHFEIKPVLLNGANAFQDNGYFGAIDPLQFLQDISAVEKVDFVAHIWLQLADISAQIQDFFLRRAKLLNKK